MMKIFAAGAFTLVFGTAAAQSAVVWNFAETGGEVVGAFTGSLDLTGTDPALFDLTLVDAAVEPAASIVVSGSGGGALGDIYGLSSVPGSSFGGGARTLASTTGGDLLAIASGRIAVPAGYTGGTVLAGTITFAGQTFASLGITPGTYVYSLPNDTITVSFGAVSAVPLPAGLPLLLAGLGALGLTRRRAA